MWILPWEKYINLLLFYSGGYSCYSCSCSVYVHAVHVIHGDYGGVFVAIQFIVIDRN